MIYLHSQGDINTKERIIPIQPFFYVQCWYMKVAINETMASVMLIYCWLKLIYKPLFTMCVVMCIQTSNINVFDPEISSPFWIVMSVRDSNNHVANVRTPTFSWVLCHISIIKISAFCMLYKLGWHKCKSLNQHTEFSPGPYIYILFYLWCAFSLILCIHHLLLPNHASFSLQYTYFTNIFFCVFWMC